MQLHQLKPKTQNKDKKRVGRGGKRGTTSGRGSKGQKARAGKKPRRTFAGGNEPFFRRIPKIRGSRAKLEIRFGVKNKIGKVAEVNLNVLEKNFNDGEIITPRVLVERGIIKKENNKIPAVKILGNGKLTKKVKIEGCAMSASVAGLFGKVKTKEAGLKVESGK